LPSSKPCGSRSSPISSLFSPELCGEYRPKGNEEQEGGRGEGREEEGWEKKERGKWDQKGGVEAGVRRDGERKGNGERRRGNLTHLNFVKSSVVCTFVVVADDVDRVASDDSTHYVTSVSHLSLLSMFTT